jgi:N-acyl homoserine lactone hydrolase
MSIEIVRLYLGSIDGFLGPATPFNGYAILHPRGVVLVDTGFGPTLGGTGVRGELKARGQTWPWVRRSTVEALADHGLIPSDVKFIVNTHLGDHSGDNRDFPHASFVIQQPEAEKARRVQPPHYLETWDFPGAKLELLQGEDAEILPGVRAIFTPGHTVGHQSVLLEDDGDRQLFVGDAVYTAEIWNRPEVMTESHPAWESQVAAGYEIWKASAEKLAAVNAKVVHFAHDPTILRAG